MRNRAAAWAASMAATAVVAIGCQWGGAERASVPETEVRREQLIVHSTFELPPHHRLLDELVALRVDVSRTLVLPLPEEPIHIYLFETASRYQAFIQEHLPEFPERRACFVETDTQLSVYAQWNELIAVDLRHEVTHGYLHAVLNNLPLWLDEGLAEYFEVARGKHGINRPHVKLLASRLVDGDWSPDIHKLVRLELADQMGQLHYAEAWAWAHFLIETTPERRELLEDYLARLRMTGKAPPLADLLLKAEPDAEQLLEMHLRELHLNMQ